MYNYIVLTGSVLLEYVSQRAIYRFVWSAHVVMKNIFQKQLVFKFCGQNETDCSVFPIKKETKCYLLR